MQSSCEHGHIHVCNKLMYAISAVSTTYTYLAWSEMIGNQTKTTGCGHGKICKICESAAWHVQYDMGHCDCHCHCHFWDFFCNDRFIMVFASNAEMGTMSWQDITTDYSNHLDNSTCSWWNFDYLLPLVKNHRQTSYHWADRDQRPSILKAFGGLDHWSSTDQRLLPLTIWFD